MKNYWQIGNGYNQVEHLSKSTLFNEGDRHASSHISRNLF